MMKKVVQLFNALKNEILIIGGFLIIIYIYLGPVNVTIKSDAAGYYDYLPSLFIHHDLIRYDKPLSEDSLVYQRLSSFNNYRTYGDFKVNKYACGTAVLELPFFIGTYLITSLEGKSEDGTEPPFQKAIFFAAIFYLFLSVFFLKKILELYDLKSYVIIITQLLLVFATTVTNYANFDAGFSHVYSLFAVTAFMYFVKSYFKNLNGYQFILACLFLGLIIILRQINAIIILFVPFLAGSFAALKNGFIHLRFNPKILLTGILIIFAIVSIQCLAWYLQTGKFIIYSYQGENFNFSHPQFFNVLFSYRKGLFVYNPILLISMLSIIWMSYKQQYYLVFTWILFFIILTYILSSWHSWSYGGSFGLRAFVEYYAVFFIIFGLMLNGANPSMKIAIIALSFFTIPLNIIQTYQYKEYIFKWDSMNKEIYWKVFLKTSKIYKGLAWKPNYNYNNLSDVKEILIGDITISRNYDTTIFIGNTKNIPEFKNVSIIQVLIDNDYDKNNDANIILTVNNPAHTQNYFWRNRYLIQFSEKGFNTWQTGLYNFELPKFPDREEKIIELELKPGKQNIILKNVRIKFLKYQYK